MANVGVPWGDTANMFVYTNLGLDGNRWWTGYSVTLLTYNVVVNQWHAWAPAITLPVNWYAITSGVTAHRQCDGRCSLNHAGLHLHKAYFTEGHSMESMLHHNKAGGQQPKAAYCFICQHVPAFTSWHVGTVRLLASPPNCLMVASTQPQMHAHIKLQVWTP